MHVFQQDSAGAHMSGDTLKFLKEFCDGRLILQKNEHFCPVHSLDLSHLDFFSGMSTKYNLPNTNG